MEDKASKQRRQPLPNHGVIAESPNCVEWNGNLTAVAVIATEIQFCEIAGWLISGWGIERESDLAEDGLASAQQILAAGFGGRPVRTPLVGRRDQRFFLLL